MEESVIEVSHVCCKAGYRYLLNDVTWKVQAGERWVVFGMNGSGKTTLLSIIAGFKHYTSGDIRLFGEPLSDNNILKVRKRIGWVSSAFFDQHYTKESAMDIVLSAKSGTLGLDDTITLADRRLAKELLAALNLTDRINYTFDMLSKGERQHVLIARAFMTDPQILILDEPGTGLDVLARERLLATIKDLAAARDTTIIYVTHYPEEILPSFDKALLLRNGTVYKIGATQELFTSEVMSDFFSFPVNIQYANERYNFSIRSEAIAVAADRKDGVYHEHA